MQSTALSRLTSHIGSPATLICCLSPLTRLGVYFVAFNVFLFESVLHHRHDADLAADRAAEAGKQRDMRAVDVQLEEFSGAQAAGAGRTAYHRDAQVTTVVDVGQ